MLNWVHQQNVHSHRLLFQLDEIDHCPRQFQIGILVKIRYHHWKTGHRMEDNYHRLLLHLVEEHLLQFLHLNLQLCRPKYLSMETSRIPCCFISMKQRVTVLQIFSMIFVHYKRKLIKLEIWQEGSELTLNAIDKGIQGGNTNYFNFCPNADPQKLQQNELYPWVQKKSRNW